MGGKSDEATRPVYYIKDPIDSLLIMQQCAPGEITLTDVSCPAPRSPGGANRPTYSVMVLLVDDILIVDSEHLW
jgi:hypothetical protein